MFITRLISGIVLVALIIVLGILGGDFLLAATFLISIIGLFELYRVFKIHKSFLGVLGYIATTVFYANLRWNFLPTETILFLGFLILIMFVFVFGYPKFDATQVAIGFFGLFYVSVMLSYIYQLRMVDHGKYLVFLIYLCAWGSDTSAYSVGMLTKKLVGKTHQMSPKLSPKKSIEGAVGGVVGAALFTFIYCMILQSQMNLSMKGIWILAGVSAIGALVSMVGDLCASAIKRFYDIKDYGKLIPGHGGIMDRFDSIIITAPIIFYLAYYLL